MIRKRHAYVVLLLVIAYVIAFVMVPLDRLPILRAALFALGLLISGAIRIHSGKLYTQLIVKLESTKHTGKSEEEKSYRDVGKEVLRDVLVIVCIAVLLVAIAYVYLSGSDDAVFSALLIALIQMCVGMLVGLIYDHAHPVVLVSEEQQT